MKTEKKLVEVKGLVAKTPDNPEGTASKAFDLVTYETSEDILNKISSAEGLADLLGDLNYGFGLAQRSKVRQALLNENQGPEKGIEKLAKDLFKILTGLGQPITMEQATQQATDAIERGKVTA